jgi:glycerophosphoryl diester phosphodiesterase
MTLEELFESGTTVATAHRGFCGKHPENTLPAFDNAIKAGADIIEFDIRSSADNVPVILHDETVDRTSNGTGKVCDLTYARLKELNFSYWVGPHDQQCRRDEPATPGLTLPTFRQTLELIGKRACMNIQVYAVNQNALVQICGLYREFDLFRHAYLTMTTFEQAQRVRAIDPEIEICVLERQHRTDAAMLRKMKDFGLTYVQPLFGDLTPGLCEEARRLGLRSSVFYSNTDERNRLLISWGQQGIMTDCIDVLVRTIAGATA